MLSPFVVKDFTKTTEQHTAARQTNNDLFVFGVLFRNQVPNDNQIAERCSEAVLLAVLRFDRPTNHYPRCIVYNLVMARLSTMASRVSHLFFDHMTVIKHAKAWYPAIR